MGKGTRDRPLRLAEKLKQIREQLDLSQDGVVIRLGCDDPQITRNSISKYELGKREPSLLILYAYAKAANIYVEVLIDDDLELPALIPSNEKSAGRKKRR
jgi:transcriptional regulator with XRE-family HTH domain